MNREEDSSVDKGERIADMSLLEDSSLTEKWFGRGRKKAGEGARSSYNELLQGEDRRTAIWGALTASLLVGLVYIAAAGLFILFLLWIWGAL